MDIIVLIARINESTLAIIWNSGISANPMIGLSDVAKAAGINQVAVFGLKPREAALGCEVINVETVLGNFVLYSSSSAVDKLIQGGANVNLRSAGSPLLCLISFRSEWRGGHAEIASSLIGAGAEQDVRCANAKMSRNDTPLMAAVADGHIGVVAVLLRAGADVHLDDGQAMNYACRKYHLYSNGNSDERKVRHGGIIGMLLAAGADSRCDLQ